MVHDKEGNHGDYRTQSLTVHGRWRRDRERAMNIHKAQEQIKSLRNVYTRLWSALSVPRLMHHWQKTL